MTKRFSVILTAMFLLVTALARAESPSVTVAVYDFADFEKNPNDGYGGKTTTLVTANLTTESNIVMLERADLNKALTEQALGGSGMVNSEAAAKIGQITGAKVLVSGVAIRMGSNRLVIVANIVGTETGRLFAERVDGTTDKFSELTSLLSFRIARSIRANAASFIRETQSHESYVDNIVKGALGTNRPAVSVRFKYPRNGQKTATTANNEMSILLQKAGFQVVDEHSDHKPEIEVSGMVDGEVGPKRANMFPARALIEMKVVRRRTGDIIALDRQEAEALDLGRPNANRSAQVKAIDALAERLVPLLGK